MNQGPNEWIAEDADPNDPWWKVYARLSMAGDADETGVDRQITDGLASAKGRGAKRIRVYADDGFSAYKRKVVRPQFEALLADVEADGLGGGNVVAWRAERLARQPRDAERLMDAILAEEDAPRAVVFTIADGVDTGTEAGTFVFRQLVQFGRWESKAISQRVARAHKAAVEAGKFTGSPPAFGHRDGTKWHEVEPAEAEAIRDAAQRIIAGEGVSSITRDWTRKGIWTRRGTGWQHVAFNRMITSPRMAGLRSVRGVESPPGSDEHGKPWIAAILDVEIWRDVRRILFDPARKPKRPGGEARHLLTNLLRCGMCLGPLRAKGNVSKKAGDDYWTYSCSKDAYHHMACGRIHIRGDHTDRFIEGIVLAHLRLPAVRAALIEGSSGTFEVNEDEATLRHDLLQLQEQIVSVEVAYLDGPKALEDRHGISPAGYRRWRETALRRRDDLDRRVSRSVRSRTVVTAIADPGGFWNQATLAEKRDVIAAVLPEIVVKSAVSIANFPQRWDQRRISWTAAG